MRSTKTSLRRLAALRPAVFASSTRTFSDNTKATFSSAAAAAPQPGGQTVAEFNTPADLQLDFTSAAAKLQEADPVQIIDTALELFGNEIAISFSGAEDVYLIELASQTGKPFRVFSLDTGRLNPETYELFQAVENHYNLKIEYCFPDTAATERLVRTKGQFSFYQDGHNECCQVRKVGPLKKQLSGLQAWITGMRQDQSTTRTEIPVVQKDPVFPGSGADDLLVKWNPLSNVKSAHLWEAIRDLGVPYNKLHDKGFISIGCAPCTRPVGPGQHEREGRWWWEDTAAKECGLHADKSGKGGGGGAALANGAAAAQAVEPVMAAMPELTTEIIFVKKMLEDGNYCNKCNDVSERMDKENMMPFIKETVVADVTDPNSEGMQIAKEMGIKTAPFFSCARRARKIR